MSNIIRLENEEPRYLVFKVTDLAGALVKGEIAYLISLRDKVESYRHEQGKPEFKGIVIESDWPEYQRTVTSLEDRINKE